MKRILESAVTMLCAVGLTACVVAEPGTREPSSRLDAQSDSLSEYRSTGESTRRSRMLEEHESSCLAAVASQTGEADVSTISVEQGETATIVLVDVRGAQAPWRCEHGATEVLRTFYTGEEGGSAPSRSTSPVALDDLVGMRAAYIDQQMGKRGFENVGGYKDADTAYTTWWKPESEQCVSVATVQGRIERIESIAPGNCL